MSRLGTSALFLLIFATSCGAAWLGNDLSRRSWMPQVAFWVTLLGLSAIAQFGFGVEFGSE